MADGDSTAGMVAKWLASAGYDIGKEAIGEIIGEYFFGGGRGRGLPMKDQLAKLFGEGDNKEAAEVLRANFLGIGSSDEKILQSDMLAIMKAPWSEKYWFVIPLWLNTLSPFEREQFRLAHVLEHDEHKRRRDLIYLAEKIKTDAERTGFIQSTGLFELSRAKKMEDAFWTWDASFAPKNDDANDEIARLKAKKNSGIFSLTRWWK